MSRLSFVPTPLENECVISVLYRCAEKNGFSSLSQFSSACGGLHFGSLAKAHFFGSHAHRLIRNDPLVDNHQRIAIDAVFLKHVKAKKPQQIQCGKLILHPSMIRSRLVVCPDCISDGNLNIMHTFSFSEICPIHSRIYLSQCPACGKPLNWITLKDFHCACSYNLRNATAIYADNKWSKLTYDSYINGDQEFFNHLEMTLMANHILHSTKERHETIDSCIRIATGLKSAFFHEIHDIQNRFPSLHRLAILAPFLLIKDTLIRSYAMEYYCNTLQSKPLSHGLNCTCNQINFRLPELILISGKQDASDLIKSPQCTPVRKSEHFTRSKQLYKITNLCLTLAQNNHLEWDIEDIRANPSTNFKLIPCEQASEIIGASELVTGRLMKQKLLKSIQLRTRRFTTKTWIENFSKTYILSSQLFSSPLLKEYNINTLLKNLPNAAEAHPTKSSHDIVHYRKHIPQHILSLIENPEIIKNHYTKANLIDIGSAAVLLRLPRKDVPQLFKLGIISSTIAISGRKGPRKFFTARDLKLAIKWRKSFVTLDEATEIIGCKSRSFIIRFIKPGYITPIKLSHLLISRSDVKKCLRHYKMYEFLEKSYNAKSAFIDKLIKSGKLHPLAADHPDALPGYKIIPIKELDKFLPKKATREIPK